METTTMTTKKRAVSIVGKEDLQNAVCSIMLGMMMEPFSFCMILPYLSYTYMKRQRDCLFACILIALCAVLREMQWAYVYAVGFTLFFLIISILRMWDKNTYRYLPWVTSLLSIPFAVLFFGSDTKAFFAVLVTMILAFELHKEESWIHQRYHIDPMIYACIIFSAMMLLNTATQDMFFFPVMTGFFILLSLICDSKVLLTFILISYLFLPFDIVDWYFPVIWMSLCIFRKEKMVAIMVLAGALLMNPSFYNAIYAFLAGGSLLLYKEEYIPFLKARKDVTEQTFGSANQLLRRQINNFSSIFDSLSAYYQKNNTIEAEMLANMAQALKYCADEVKRISEREPVKERILHALEGYRYEVSYFMMEEIKEGILHLELDIKNIKKAEVKNTLLPLLEILLHTNLEICNLQHIRFTHGFYHIVLETCVPFVIDCYGTSLKNPFEESGDAYSVFRFRQSVVCMISDGMGIGRKAGDASRLITNIFQRMIVCGMAQIEAIKCINKLIQSESYATLDVLSFDQGQGKAYILKSAACPTYLIRENELHMINGTSLPIGIISQIEPDCYQMDIKENDEFLMVSDGVTEKEIMQWLSMRKKGTAKESVSVFLELLKQKERRDDSTILYANVSSAGDGKKAA